MPKDIFDNVDAKQDIDATTELPSAMVARFSTGMSAVCFPKPRSWPTWVMIASARRMTFDALGSVGEGIGREERCTHEMIRT